MERQQRLVLPPDSPFPVLNSLREEMADLEEKRRLASVAIDARDQGLDAARKLDLRDQGEAMRKGAKDPGTKREAKLLKEKEEWEGKFAVASQALELAQNEVVMLVEEERDSWIEIATVASGEARTAYRSALEAVVQADRELREANAILRWVAQFPDVKSFKTPTGLTSLRAPSSDPYPVNVVLQALIEEAEVVPNYAFTGAGPPQAKPMTQEEAQALVEEQRQRRIEMGYELPPRKVTPPSSLPPNAVLGGREVEVG